MTQFWEAMRGGYAELTGGGQYLALFFVALIGFYFYPGKKERIYWYYSVAMSLVLLFPVTAWVLWKYQTRFYAYGHLWALVPITGMIAYGGVLLLEMAQERCADHKLFGHKKYSGELLLAVFGLVILLAGSVTPVPQNRQETANDQKIPARQMQALEWIQENVEEPCLWAARDVLEYARAYSGNFELIYGRNMWELSLNGNTYDWYDQQVLDMYEQMEDYEFEAGQGRLGGSSAQLLRKMGQDLLDVAENKDCNVVVLPKGDKQEWTLGETVGDHFLCSFQTEAYVIFTKELSENGKVE